jgi:hypothetical protein
MNATTISLSLTNIVMDGKLTRVYQFANDKTACKLHVHNMQLQNRKHMFAIVINEQHPFDDNLGPGIFIAKTLLIVQHVLAHCFQSRNCTLLYPIDRWETK